MFAVVAIAAAAATLAFTAAAFVYGVRYPPLQFEPNPLPRAGDSDDGMRISAAGAFFQGAVNGVLAFRAFAPEPALDIHVGDRGRVDVTVTNLHPEARIETDGSTVGEQVDGLRRTLHATAPPGTSLGVRWVFPRRDRFRFAVIGDSGGGSELAWALRRAAALGADFLIHLGDLYYMRGDLQRAVEHFNNADIPSFVAIGNHEFVEDGEALFEDFTRGIGPRNSTFRLGGVQFVNIDSAAGTFPASGGDRGRLIRDLPARGESQTRDFVVYTHMPLTDPRAQEDPTADHSMTGVGEANWLRTQLLSRGVDTLLAGHLHYSEEFDDAGMRTFVVGEGLGHRDLLAGKPIARLLIGDVAPGKAVRYRWKALDMPADAHCNDRAWELLETIGKTDLLAHLKQVCVTARALP